MSKVDGDPELFREAVELFLADRPKALAEIAGTISAKEADRSNPIA
jgi:HPt (histidine-containing phosphotransfer) domain-containing protein